jgi:hypothetical protein
VAQDASETGLIQAFEVAAKLDTIVRKEMSIALQLQIKDCDVSSWAESVTASLKTFAAV